MSVDWIVVRTSAQSTGTFFSQVKRKIHCHGMLRLWVRFHKQNVIDKIPKHGCPNGNSEQILIQVRGHKIRTNMRTCVHVKFHSIWILFHFAFCNGVYQRARC
jgi:hypothetical protein